ncbi:hypothetical protein [Streptomyces sp. NBC_00091]|uniref:hypothetical protein n=1 Tax=Streptomyces sp. NBC_00091 TaxID=2975648 RepID=UPI00224F0032|nr:hypothetical protein [Streptomyces sp. NBC_00091]MCX5379182.1 hypothetical protein [Streptomyces sp. NBC_00091]
MHSYDPSRAPSRTSTVSHTPIYDSLYSEYLRAFRALPGDRTGEEDLGFTAFSYGGASYGGASYGGAFGGSYGGGTGSAYGSGWNGSSWQQADGWQPSYVPQQAQPAYSYAGGSGYGGGRQHQTGMQHIPAALPPAPRRGY